MRLSTRKRVVDAELTEIRQSVDIVTIASKYIHKTASFQKEAMRTQVAL